MRLLSVHRLHYRHGGAEAVHLDHLALFREHGWECAEFSMQHPRNEPSAFASYFPAYFEPSTAKGLERFASAARFLHAPEVYEKFGRLLADFKPDVIHIHGVYYQLTAGILKVAKSHNIPVVFTLHDYKQLCPAHHLFRADKGPCEDCKGGHQYRAFTNKCLHGSYAVSALYALDGMIQWHTNVVRKNVSMFVGPSQFLINKYIEHGYAPDSLRYVPNFFETTDTGPVSVEAIAALRARYGRFVLYFGRLSVEKGVSDLVAAAHAAGARLVLAGQGPEEAKLRAQVSDLGADVIFTGYLSGNELWAHVEAADIVSMSSICNENAPKALLEAMARGKLVVITAAGGMPEMVRNGETGFVSPMADVPALGRALRAALDLDPAEAARLGAQARAYVTKTFTRERYFQEMSEIYAQVARNTVEPQDLALA